MTRNFGVFFKWLQIQTRYNLKTTRKRVNFIWRYSMYHNFSALLLKPVFLTILTSSLSHCPHHERGKPGSFLTTWLSLPHAPHLPRRFLFHLSIVLHSVNYSYNFHLYSHGLWVEFPAGLRYLSLLYSIQDRLWGTPSLIFGR
jgi:hypothetical protein